MATENPDLSRRALVQAATLVPFSAIRGTAANSAVTVGLVGSGNRGTYIAGLVQEHTLGRVTALCDLFPEHMERAKAKIGLASPRFFADYHEMLASDVDAVLIATPVFLHAEHFAAAVEARKHIYIEKPAAPDVAGCQRIARAARAADPKLNIAFGFQRRYGHVYRQAKKLQDSGAIGPVRLAQVQFVKSGGAEGTSVEPPKSEADKVKQWYLWRRLSGDLIVENNIHLIDVMNWFVGGRPSAAVGSGGQKIPRPGDVRDHGNVTYTYEGGVRGAILGSTLAPPFYRKVFEQLFGSEGMIETAAEYWSHHKGRNDVATEESPRNISIDAMAEFVRRIREGRPENTAERGAESTLTAILGRVAMDKGREVTWEEMLRAEP